MSDFTHRSVLLAEAVALISPRPGGVYVDCTLGGGGHAEALLEASGPGGRILGIDRDPRAIRSASERLARFGARFEAVLGSFGDLPRILADRGLDAVDGVLADLGVSSPQLDDPERGFSFREDGPLDMRMGPGLERSAADLINEASREELARILREYGEERKAWAVAGAIVEQRPFTRTAPLAACIAAVVGKGKGRIHPATLSFQGLRIAVNDELGQLDALLAALPGCLAPGGRAAIISFHSLEDRRVKRCFRELAGVGTPRDAYGDPLEAPTARLLTTKAVVSTDDNPRARSARLRGIERL
ncbi:MAG: 16S rRNA (cytosine(1402)-N(4))-methyltransferase RsmH [Alphaproteobacteria bacterium]|nr:16S rRNA (cytosine(1402)-N(4))-methyltransferase RsmH [Alphaproteobacteria bacterium]